MTQDEFELIAHEFGVEHPFEVGRRHGLAKDELLAHMKVHNDRIENEWLADYASRMNRPVDEVRTEVINQRRIIAESCNRVH